MLLTHPAVNCYWQWAEQNWFLVFQSRESGLFCFVKRPLILHGWVAHLGLTPQLKKVWNLFKMQSCLLKQLEAVGLERMNTLVLEAAIVLYPKGMTVPMLARPKCMQLRKGHTYLFSLLESPSGICTLLPTAQVYNSICIYLLLDRRR